MTRSARLEEQALAAEMRTLAETLTAALNKLTAEIGALRADLQQPKADPHESEGRLLHEIYRATGGRGFLISDLFLDVEIHLNAGDEALRRAIVDVAGGLNSRKLGNCLASIEGRVIDGFRVQRLKNTRDGIRWIVKM